MFASLRFVVSLPPSIIIHPMGERILKGSNYTLMCSASGSGILTYSWERSSNGSSWTIVSDDNTTSYTTDTSLAIGQYMYRCNVSNDGGSVVSNIAIVDVYGKYALIFVYAITCTLFTEVLDHPCNFKYVV